MLARRKENVFLMNSATSYGYQHSTTNFVSEILYVRAVERDMASHSPVIPMDPDCARNLGRESSRCSVFPNYDTRVHTNSFGGRRLIYV